MSHDITVNDKEKVWALKYRPSKLNEIILPDRIKSQLQEVVSSGSSPHLLLSGPPGISKTTTARAIANELGASVLFINSSLETGVDVLRDKVSQFCSTVSAFGSTSRKVVIMDECEAMSPNALQAIRGVLEQFAKVALFIGTTNYPNKLPEPFMSRFNHIQFDFTPDEQQELVRSAFLRSKTILDNEGVEYDQKVVAQVVKSSYPDFRKMLTTLQKGTINGVLKPIVLQGGDAVYSTVVEYINDKNWSEMRKWVSDNINNFDYQSFYNEFARQNQGKPILADATILSAKYDYQSAFATSKEITAVAFLTELMMAG